MDFNTLIAWSGKFYSLLKKLNLDHKLDLDYIIDNNYPEVLSKMLSYSGIAKIAECDNLFNIKNNISLYI